MPGVADLYVKICGLTDEASVTAAVEAGADAIGLVVVPSPRQVSPGRAATLAAHGRAEARRLGVPLEVVAVYRWPSTAEVLTLLDAFNPDRVQVYPPDLDALGALGAPGVRWLLAFRGGCPLPHTDEVIVVDGPKEGSGETGDWRAVAEAAARGPVILAGGLHLGNVAAAIARVAPHGVDVSSGVEEAPGRKSASKIRDFVARAREAARGEV